MPANAIHIPEELVQRIDSAKESKGGYSNRAEFVREAIRLRCEQIEAEETNAKKNEGRGGAWP